MIHHLPTLGLLVATTFAFTAVSDAAVIFSSYNGTDGGTESLLHNNSGKAVGFTLPDPLQPADTGSYQLDGITLRLSGSVSDSQVVVKLFSNDGTNTPGTELGTLTSTTAFTLTATAAGYTFAPASGLTLTAGTTYWIAVQGTHAEGSATLSWKTSASQPASLSGVGITAAGQIFGAGSNPSTWASTSGVRNALTIEATALPVPEPAAPLLAGAGLISITAIRRRRR